MDTFLHPKNKRFPPIGPLTKVNIVTGRFMADEWLSTAYDCDPVCYHNCPDHGAHYTQFEGIWQKYVKNEEPIIVLLVQSYEFIEVGARMLSAAGVDFALFRPVEIDGKPECTCYSGEDLLGAVNTGWEVR